MWYNNRNAAIVRLDRLIQRRKFGKGAISILRIWYCLLYTSDAADEL